MATDTKGNTVDLSGLELKAAMPGTVNVGTRNWTSKDGKSKGTNLDVLIGGQRIKGSKGGSLPWDSWFEVSKLIAFAAQHPEKGEALARNLQAKYVAHMGLSNGALSDAETF